VVDGEYPIPTANSYPFGITVGPDGDVWFTEYAANQIGVFLQTSGKAVISEIPIPTAYSGPWGITAGPDGAVWFAEGNANMIGRITTAGVITDEFPIPTANSLPYYGITAGPNGALWFLEAYESANNIGRITTAGVVTEFPIPRARSNPNGITAGPDGTLWFIELPSGSDLGIGIGRLAVTVNTHDFNGDGMSDIAWRDSSGDNWMWLMNGGTILSSAGLGNISTAWSIVGQRDFNGDGMADLL
jgi:streptogramin lyase